MLVYYFGLKRGDDKMLNFGHPRRLDLSVRSSIKACSGSIVLDDWRIDLIKFQQQVLNVITASEKKKKKFTRGPEGALLDTNYRRAFQLLLWAFFIFCCVFFKIYKECVMFKFKASGGNFTCILTNVCPIFPSLLDSRRGVGGWVGLYLFSGWPGFWCPVSNIIQTIFKISPRSVPSGKGRW